MTTGEIILIILLVLVIGAIIFAIIYFAKNKNNKNQVIDQTTQNELIKNSFELMEKRLADEQKKSNENVLSNVKTAFETMGKGIEQLANSAGEIKNFSETSKQLVNVMNNVKIRGVFGEVQLANILEQFLTKNQYVENFQAKPNSQERVEFAVTIPTNDPKNPIYLPIDSKFPMSTYIELCQAQEKGDQKGINLLISQLKRTVINMAKDIHDKYINPPLTTEYAIMFLPTESLYVEVIRMGLLDELQRKYQVTVAGPTTISALLISFKMGFKSFKIQQDAAAIWKDMAALKTQFNLLDKEMTKVSKAFNTANDQFDKLANTRFRMIRSKMKDIDELTELESNKIIGMDDPEKIQNVLAEESENEDK